MWLSKLLKQSQKLKQNRLFFLIKYYQDNARKSYLSYLGEKLFTKIADQLLPLIKKGERHP